MLVSMVGEDDGDGVVVSGIRMVVMWLRERDELEREQMEMVEEEGEIRGVQVPGFCEERESES